MSDPSGTVSWLGRPLESLTTRLLRCPRLVLLLAALLTVAAVLYAVTFLGFRGSRLDLLNPASAFNRRWLAYLDEFGDQDDVVIVVIGAGAEQVTPALQEIDERLSGDEAFQAVLSQRDVTGLRRKAIHYLDPEQLDAMEQLVADSAAIIAGDWNSLRTSHILAKAQQANSMAGDLAANARSAEWFRSYWNGLADALIVGESRHSPWAETATALRELDQAFRSGYMLSDQGRLGVIVLRLQHRRERPQAIDQHVQKLRKVVRAVQQLYPAVTVGLTGMPVLEVDEMEASTRDSATASLLSFVGVAVVFLVGFGGFRRPFFAVAVLAMSLAWSLAYTSFSIGHLNVLSAAFGVILIGLGVDFSIHYLSHYAVARREAADCAAALVGTARSVGPGIVTGGITTALAFSTAGLTEFTGVAELGVIVAGGIVLCVFATIVVLPALVLLWDRPQAPSRWLPFDAAGFFGVSSPRLDWRFALAIVISVVIAAGTYRVEYDHNLLNLQPATLKSVELERELTNRLDRGVWYALSVAKDAEELVKRKQQFEGLSNVTGTEDIVSLIPVGSLRRQRAVAGISQRLQMLPQQVPAIPVDSQQELLRSIPQGTPQDSGSGARFGKQAEAIARLPVAVYYERMSRFQQRTAAELLSILWTIRSMADPAVPRLADLPDALTVRFVGKRGRHLLRVFGHADIWNIEPLERFVKELETIDPQVTGHPVQTYYASRQMQKSFVKAAIYSLLAVFVVLLIDFRKIRFCLLAMVPMLLGMALMFGTLGWLGIPLNPANMIVLPLILGIGIDDGVHVVHDCIRQSSSTYRLSDSTANAVILTSATTMVGFGSLMLASHRGLRSLGQVLTIGIFWCLLTSLFALPSLLRWIRGAFSAGR